MNLPLIDGTTWTPPDTWLAQLAENYKGLDVGQQMILMRGWLLGNFHRRKTRRGIQKFVTGWLNRAYGTAPKLISERPATCCECRSPAVTGGRCQRHADHHLEYLNSIRSARACQL